MAGDRRAALIVRAAARGVVDFSQFAPADRQWWLRLNWLLNEIGTDDTLRLAEARHRQYCSSLSAMESKVRTHSWELASKEVESLRSLMFPWDAKSKQPIGEEAAKQQYLSIVGDPKKDPEVAERLRKTVEYLKSLSRGAAERRRKQKAGPQLSKRK